MTITAVNDTVTYKSARGDNDTVRPADLVVAVAQGGVASGATDSGNPVKVAGVHNTTLPTLTNGQRGDLQVNARGALKTVASVARSGGFDAWANSDVGYMYSDTSHTNAVALASASLAFNGSTWDRVRNAGVAGSGLLAELGPYTISRKTADGQVKATAGFVHTVTISPLTATPTAGLLTIYDSASETGTILYTEWVFATDTGHSVTLDAVAATGIYVGFDATLANVAVSVSFR